MDRAFLKRFLLPWAAMLLLLGVQLLLPTLHAGILAPFLGLLVAAIVVAVPMELPRAPSLARVFALAGAFWLVFMLFGLGMLDPLTRHHQPTEFHSEP